jgi:hypothetical protein
MTLCSITHRPVCIIGRSEKNFSFFVLSDFCIRPMVI